MAGMTDSVTVTWLAFTIYALYFLCVLFAVYMVEKLGRRPLVIASLLGRSWKFTIQKKSA